jgi:beta-glucanase (GH16 family)
MKLWIFIFQLLFLCFVYSQDWELVWSDEFNIDGMPDSSKWDYEVGFIRNNESQYYTRERTENARIENGCLVIESRREKYKESNYTSASLITRGKGSWTYGKIEVRAKLPSGIGMWPAIWMLGVNIKEVGWPRCGEIDIMENVGFNPDLIHGNIHTEKYNHTKGTNKGSKIKIGKPYLDFHIYSIIWNQNRIDFFVDGQKYFTYQKESSDPAVWPFDQKFYLILNAAIGGSWGGQQGVDDSIFPQKYLIDYVRVYQQK